MIDIYKFSGCPTAFRLNISNSGSESWHCPWPNAAWISWRLEKPYLQMVVFTKEPAKVGARNRRTMYQKRNEFGIINIPYNWIMIIPRKTSQ